MLVVILTTLTNRNLTDGDPIIFDDTRYDKDGATTPSGAWDVGDPERLTVPRDLTDCKVEVHLTTLGTDYGGASNANIVISVLKNWSGAGEYLSSTIAAVRWQNLDGVHAHLNELTQSIGDLANGDVLQVVLATTGGSVMVEANPTTTPPAIPGDFDGEAGSGVIGTHFVLRGI